MKLHFESDLLYRIDAIAAVCDLSRGQQLCRSALTGKRSGFGLRPCCYARAVLPGRGRGMPGATPHRICINKLD
jgi:hypothetical protein